MRLDDLHRLLSDPFQEGWSFPELEETCREAAKIIGLVDDWATAKRKLDEFTEETRDDFHLSDRDCDKFDRLHISYREAESALLEAAKVE